ncbi:MAG TPA: hypothetical protein PKC58_17130 [Ignavibacteria bacterium]|nr:hypothetical protein [Ignavibacteria bacterium]
MKSNEVISLLNQCKNGNILEYTNKLESLFNLNPGENISIGNVVDLMEAELDNGGLTVFQSIFKFE